MKPQGYSTALERLIVDFGAECSFSKSACRLQLHHRLKISESSVRKITLKHALAIKQSAHADGVHGRLQSQGAETIVTEMDGCMLPIVECSAGKENDRRKRRDCHWEEVRLCAAQVHGKSFTHYGVCLGSVEQAGYTWSATVAKAGWSAQTHIHALGDGASWLARQSRQCLDADYLLDLFHVCDYLAAAGQKIATHTRWLEVQKNRLKTNHPERVIETLRPHVEPEHVPENEAPVRSALRYLENRLDQLNYKEAIEKDLPVGSGMIEAGHRHVLQARLKISGAWWTRDNAASIAALRVSRQNQEDDDYWKNAA